MKRRGVSEIIATLLLMGITVAGAVLVSAFLSGNNLSQAQTNQSSQSSSIKITGYDTRDGINLSAITSFNNCLNDISLTDCLATSPTPSPKLCTTSCSVSPNNIPSAAVHGTEFIILTVRNTGPNSVEIQSVEVNNVEHSWDQNTKDVNLSMTAPPSYPRAGYFSIISTSNSAPIKQMSDNKLNSDNEVRLVIKLSSTITPDIGINQPVEVRVFTDLNDAPATSITSGGVR